MELNVKILSDDMMDSVTGGASAKKIEKTKPLKCKCGAELVVVSEGTRIEGGLTALYQCPNTNCTNHGKLLTNLDVNGG